MKSLVFVVAFALLAFAAPALAAETSTAAPTTPLLQQIEGATPAPLELFKPPILQRCSAVDGTPCTTTGATMACTDACNDQLSCTCVFFNSTRFWSCSVEC